MWTLRTRLKLHQHHHVKYIRGSELANSMCNVDANYVINTYTLHMVI